MILDRDLIMEYHKNSLLQWAGFQCRNNNFSMFFHMNMKSVDGKKIIFFTEEYRHHRHHHWNTMVGCSVNSFTFMNNLFRTLEEFTRFGPLKPRPTT